MELQESVRRTIGNGGLFHIFINLTATTNLFFLFRKRLGLNSLWLHFIEMITATVRGSLWIWRLHLAFHKLIRNICFVMFIRHHLVEELIPWFDIQLSSIQITHFSLFFLAFLSDLMSKNWTRNAKIWIAGDVYVIAYRPISQTEREENWYVTSLFVPFCLTSNFFCKQWINNKNFRVIIHFSTMCLSSMP